MSAARVLGRLGLLLATLALAPAGRADAALEKFLVSTGLQDYAVSYEDEQGRALTKAEFAEARKTAKAFSMSKDATKKTAVLRVGSPAGLADDAADKLKPGDAFPDFAGLQLDGTPRTLKAASSQHQLVAFFMEHCAPCIAEIPDLNALAAKHPERLQVVGVSPDALGTTRRIAKRYDIRYATLSEAKDSIDHMGVRSYPLLVLLRPDGRVAAVKRGYSVGKESHLAMLEAWLDKGMAAGK